MTIEFVNPKTYEIILDRYLGTNQDEVVFHQYDTESAKLRFTFLENGVPFIIPYTRLVLIVKKPDKKEVYQDIDVFSVNTAEVILKNQALTVVGALQCQIKMYQDSKLESTWTFEVKVKPGIGNDNPIKSENEYQILHRLIQDVDDNIQKNNQALLEALAQIDQSELVRMKGVIELLQQNKLGVTDKAADSILLNGTAADVNATSNTIVKRTVMGDVAVRKLALGGNGSEVYLDASSTKCIPSFKDGITNGLMHLLTSRELPIEKGTFTPYGYGGDNAEQFVHTSQRGTYYKIGKLVTVQGRIIASGFQNARGHFRIGGLPFRIREQYPPCIIGFMAGIKTLNSNSQITAYGENAYQFIQFVINDLNTGGGWSNITVDKLIAPLDISFNMTYLVD